ncbi:MAG: hypothetical protein LBQ39_06010 [Tannerellaceae bacterium]|jgi:hypothetical protein|nr:hypothetical protein [Tannerellaceae bacterium]
MKRFMAVFFALLMIAVLLPSEVLAAPPDNYNLEIDASKVSDNIIVMITNKNKFVINDIAVSINTEGKNATVEIGSIAAGATWRLGETPVDYKNFVQAAYYEGYPNTDIYAHDHARVSPDIDPDSAWEKTITKQFPDLDASVTVKFVKRGPRLMYSGHSFTGYWDSSYYYFLQLAKEGGWNAQIAYSYWGGTGIKYHGGILERPGTYKDDQLKPFDQNKAVFDANEYYDYYSVAGNTDEGVTTVDGSQNDASQYTQRTDMLAGAKVLYDIVKEKNPRTRMILWSTRGYKYGFYYDMGRKPSLNAKDTKVGEVVQIDTDNDGIVDTEYTKMLSSRGHAHVNANWYEDMAQQIHADDPTGIAPIVAHVGTAYDWINTYHPEIDPYLTPDTQGGDYAHQNNIGNYIAACVYYALIFGESPEGLSVPKTNTTDPTVSFVTDRQAKIIQEAAWKVVSGQYVLAAKPFGEDERNPEPSAPKKIEPENGGQKSSSSGGCDADFGRASLSVFVSSALAYRAILHRSSKRRV